MSKILLQATRKYPSIPTVGSDPKSLAVAVQAIRDAVQTHERRDGDPLSSFVRLKELIDLGLVRRVGNELVLTFDPADSGGGGGAVDSVNGQTGIVVLALDDITDVAAPSPSDGDVLTYDATYGLWLSEAPTSATPANVTPDTHPSSPNAMDDEFEATSLDAKWAWRNQGAATISFTKGAAVIYAPNSASIQQRIIEQAAPAGAFKIRCKVQQWLAAANYTRAGLFVLRTASSKMLAVDLAYSTGFKYEANSWNVAGAYIGSIGSAVDSLGDAYGFCYLEIEYDGSSVYSFRVSRSGYDGTFLDIGTQAQATNLGGAADKVGIYVNVENSAGESRGAFDWFRRVS